MAKLYSRITSDAYSRKFAEVGKLADEILELDVQEKRAHDGVWKKRGSMAIRIQNAIREVETEVAAVIEGPEDERAPSPFGAKGIRHVAAEVQAQGRI